MRALVILSFLAATPAFADDTFEVKAAGAQRVTRIETVVWALTASCEAGDDTQQRQCRRVRDSRAAQLAGATLLVDADKDAFDVGAWSAQKKSVALTLKSCIRCAGVEIDGKSYVVAGTGEAKLYDNAKQLADEAAAKTFTKSAANARVQMLVKVPAKAKTVVAGKPAVTFDVLGYRVYSPCDGTVILASPKSAATEPDRKQCGAIAKGNPDAPEVDTLTSSVITVSMKPVVDEAKACFKKFAVSGKAKLKLTVLGDGSVIAYEQQGDFVNTPTGQCVDAAIVKASFPRSKKPKTSISFPLQLQ
jgi:hypothetical protein